MARRTPASGNGPGRCQPTGGAAADAFFSNAAGLQAVGFGGEPVGDAKRWFASSGTGVHGSSVEVRMGGVPAHSNLPQAGWHSTAGQQHSTQQHEPQPQNEGDLQALVGGVNDVQIALDYRSTPCRSAGDRQQSVTKRQPT
jgi:hypothetical protein